MPQYLTDENISPVVAQEIRRTRPDIEIQSLMEWHEGRYVTKGDDIILEEAHAESRTFITYDRISMRSLLNSLYNQNRTHSGVVFIDNRSIQNNDFGKLIGAITNFCDLSFDSDLINSENYLRPSP